MLHRFTLFISALLFTISYGDAQNSWHKLTSYSEANSFNYMTMGKNNTVYGITPDDWIYYSQNNGDSWNPFIDVPAYYNVDIIKASKTTGRVYASSITSGIVFTDDYGATWNHNNINTNSTSGFGIQINKIGVHETKVAVVGQGPLAGPIANPIYISNNQGSTFNQVGVLGFYPKDLHFYNNQQVFANGAQSGIYFTSDIDANNWQQIAFPNKQVSDIEIYGDSIIAAVNDGSGNASIHLSIDMGNTWSVLGNTLNGQTINYISHTSDNDKIFAACVDQGVSELNNGTWSMVYNKSRTFPILSTNDYSVLFSGPRYRGVKKITPNGGSLETITEGLRLSTDLMEVTSNDKIYIASNRKTNLSIYDINQHSWSYKSLFDTIDDTRITAMDVTNSGKPIIGGIKYIARVVNNQDSLEIIANNNSAPLAPVYNTLSPIKMFVGNNNSIAMVQHATQDYVDYTEDMGGSWSVLYDANVQTPALFQIEKIASGTSIDYVFGNDLSITPMILASDDDGSSWLQLPALPSGQSLKDIFIDRQNTLFAVSTTNIFEWDSTQNTWNQHPISFSGPNNHIEMSFDQNNNIYVLVRTTVSPFPEEGIHYSFDGGQSYQYDHFPTINGEVVRFKRLKFASGDIPIAFTEEKTHNASLDGIYYLSEEPILNSPTLSQKENTKVHVYPNPADHQITVDIGSTLNSEARLTGLSGQYTQIRITGNKVNLESVASGAYILSFKHKEKMYRKKIIVTH